MSPRQLQSKFKSVDVSSIAKQSIEETKASIIERQQEQLRYGLNSEGKRIGRYKDKYYARMKNEMNPLPGFGNADLINEKNFYRALFVKVEDGLIVIDSTDSKSFELQKKYPEALGLDPDHKKGYIQELKPVFYGLYRMRR